MAILKYKQRPPQVDAIQFVGGASNGNEIVNWINMAATSFGAVWLDAQPATVDEAGATVPGRDEIVRMFSPSGAVAVNKTDYVVREGSGFAVYKKSAFEIKYEPVTTQASSFTVESSLDVS